jgi:DNA-binding transcriptional regulator LsrR (DeoR family)
MTAIDRKANRKYLKHGDQKLIAQSANVSERAVAKYLAGEVQNSSIEVYFEKLVNKRKEELERSFQ